jgi:hypothetical protein
MTEILIRGMFFPREGHRVIRIYADGRVEGEHSGITLGVADELPEHGDLIDRDAFREENDYYLHREFINPKYEDTLDDLLNDAPVIIPASKEETE